MRFIFTFYYNYKDTTMKKFLDQKIILIKQNRNIFLRNCKLITIDNYMKILIGTELNSSFNKFHKK